MFMKVKKSVDCLVLSGFCRTFAFSQLARFNNINMKMMKAAEEMR